MQYVTYRSRTRQTCGHSHRQTTNKHIIITAHYYGQTKRRLVSSKESFSVASELKDSRQTNSLYTCTHARLVPTNTNTVM